MIVRRRSLALPIDSFAAQIDAARRATVLWLSDARPVATAFHVTSDVVLAPRFVTKAQREPFAARGFVGEEREVLARIASADEPESAKVTVFSLEAPRTMTPGLSLSMRAVEPGDDVVLVHVDVAQNALSLSLGRVLSVDGDTFDHDATSMFGSAGGALLDNTGQVIGVHLGTNGASANRAVSVARILEDLRRSQRWTEVARAQRIVDATSAPSTAGAAPDDPPVRTEVALALAARWSFDPNELDEVDRAFVKDRVVDARAKRWTLTSAARRRALKGASREQLRSARQNVAVDSAEERALAVIIEADTVSAEAFEDDELPYAVQAVGWFSSVIEGLPSIEALQRRIARRRLRARLAKLAGGSFVGRARELAQLCQWFERSPATSLSLYGIGGMGKSALLARFVEHLSQDILVLWLDFDRPDIAPDDAWAVIDAIEEQCRDQLDRWSFDGARGERDERDDSWKRYAESLGAAIEACLSSRPALVVLDSFEVAQHAHRREELWRTLERLCRGAPSLRVLVSGRAGVDDLPLLATATERFALDRLDPEDEDKWLADNGVRDAETRAKIARLCQGVPLKLKLAVALLREGGSIDSVPQSLESKLVEGYLYDRILDRVVSAELRPLARAVLVVRSVDVALLESVFSRWIPEGWTAARAFEQLARELALVEGTNVLTVRSEVRRSVLELIEREDPGFVRAIDRRAKDYYAPRRTESVAHAAELVYHALRLGMQRESEFVWREAQQTFGDAWGPFAERAFEDAGETLFTNRLVDPSVEPRAQETSARWLEQRLSHTSNTAASVEQWESVAVQRIREGNARGLERSTAEFLKERGERSKDSALHFFDAWALAKDGRIGEALARVDSVDREVFERRFDLLCLDAWLARHEGDLPRAQRSLARASVVDPSDAELLAARGAIVTRFDSARETVAALRELPLTRDEGAGPSVLPLELQRSIATGQPLVRRGFEPEAVRRWFERTTMASLDRAHARLELLARDGEGRSLVAMIELAPGRSLAELTAPLFERVLYDPSPYPLMAVLALLPDPLEQIIDRLAGKPREAYA